MASLSHRRARELLQVDRHATPDDIRRAYRRAARTYHPDAGGDAAVFQDLVAAVDLLLDRADRDPPVAASPSTGRRAYPSTTGQYGRGGAEADDVDLSLLADATAPGTGDAWSVAGVAAAVAGAYDTSGPDRISGVSRRPGSFLNRVARHLSNDLLSRWEVTGATRRGVAGRDLEMVATFPPGARRRIDRAGVPAGWSTTRNPAATESTYVVHPGPSETATAVLVAEALSMFCDAIEWPLGDWYRTE